MRTDTIVAITGTFIALLALGITIWEGRESRKHNRLSVRPSLRFDIFFSTKESSRIVLCNVGLGPMIVKKIQIITRDHVIDANKQDWVKEVIRHLAQTGLKNGHLGAFSLNPTTFELDDIIQAGEQLNLLEMIDDKSEDRYFSKALTRLGLRVEYQSFYGERFVAENQEIDGQDD